jgi:hypothetical protein
MNLGLLLYGATILMVVLLFLFGFKSEVVSSDKVEPLTQSESTDGDANKG